MGQEHQTGLSRRGMFQLMAGRAPDAPAGPSQEAAASWRDRGMAAFSAGDMDEAVANLRLWLRQTPGDDEARMLLGRALYAMERHVQALVEFERVARRSEGHPAGLYLCLCRLRLGRAAKALEAYSAWAGASPQTSGGWDTAELRPRLAGHVEAAAADPAQSDRAARVLEETLDALEGLAALPSPGGERV